MVIMVMLLTLYTTKRITSTMGQKRKTSVNVDQDVWMKWNHFVIDKTGSSRRVSQELEKALLEYIEKHRQKRL